MRGAPGAGGAGSNRALYAGRSVQVTPGEGMEILAVVTIKALIFDFDGLLMDTETTLLESWRWEWRRHGLRLDPTDFFADHGGDANEPRYATLAAAVGDAYDRASSHALRMAY